MKTKKILTASFLLLATLISINADAKASKKTVSGQLNLNTASSDQLDALPGISPKKAEAIVDYRKEHPFKAIDELDNVTGFTPKSIEKLKPYLSLEGKNNLKVEKGKTEGKKKHASAKSKKGKTKKA